MAPPYTAMELAGLRLDASRQSTPERRRASEAILTLGAGVGLDGRWSMDVRGSDISRQGAVVLVEVGSPTARVVPVLAAFENDLLKLADLAGEDYLVGGKARSKNKASRALNRFESGPGRPKLSASRARSTWLVTHLTIGTRLKELAAAAGIKQVSSLDELLPYVAPLTDLERNRMLRGDP